MSGSLLSLSHHLFLLAFILTSFVLLQARGLVSKHVFFLFAYPGSAIHSNKKREMDDVCVYLSGNNTCLSTYRILREDASPILWKLTVNLVETLDLNPGLASRCRSNWHMRFSWRMKHRQLKCGHVWFWITWGTRLDLEEEPRDAQQNDQINLDVCITKVYTIYVIECVRILLESQ